MGGGGGGTSTITEIALPTYADEHAKKYMSRAQHMTKSDGALQYDYEGDTFAEWNQDEQDGITAIVTRATNGSATVTKGKSLLDDIYDKITTGANPKLVSLFNAEVAIIKKEFIEETIPIINVEANNLGMYGSTGHAVRQARAAESTRAKLNKISADIFYSDYEIERRRSVIHYSNAILYGHEELRNAEALRQAGLYRREYYQAQHTDAFKLWMAEQDGAIRKIDVYANALRCLRGAYISKTEPYYRPSGIAQIAGLAIAGGGLMASYYGMKRADISAESKAFNPQSERLSRQLVDQSTDGSIEV